MNVVKRDGRIEFFDYIKVFNAVHSATQRTKLASNADLIAKKVTRKVMDILYGDKVSVDTIHNTVENVLMHTHPEVAKEYIIYRQKRTDIRESNSAIMESISAISREMHKDNANTNNSSASKMYGIAESANKAYVIPRLLKPIHAENHEKGIVYINDLGYYQHTFNCFFSPVGEMLKNGFDNGVGSIRSPKRIGSAMALVAIILQSAQNSMFGGQGVVSFDTDLKRYVEFEYLHQLKQIIEAVNVLANGRRNYHAERALAMKRTEETVYQACEAFVYNMNTMRSRSGAQVTFSSINFGTDTDEFARMISRNILKAYMSGLGNGENPIFPNLCFRVKSGVNQEPGTPNYDIYRLALQCVGKRIQPRFVFADASFNIDNWETAATMGCRTAVRSNINGDTDPNARGNLAFNNISLPYIALEVTEKGQTTFSAFMDRLNEVVDQAIDQLYERYKVISKLRVSDVPFVSQWYQGHEGLTENDTVEPMVRNGSLSMGFIGLAEALTALFGKHHGESDEAQEHGLKIVEFLRKKTDEATKKYGLNFSTFATPSESACYTLLKLAKDRFGEVKGVTDKEYFTNSSHLPVGFDCSMTFKIDREAPYHKLCNAGHIMYVEMKCSPRFNVDAVESIVNYMAKSDVAYGGINWVHAFCNTCTYQGDFQEECPNCGGKDIKVTAIITGYLSEKNRFNKGKVAELNDRTAHKY